MDPQNRVLLEQSWLALNEAQVATGPLVDTRTGVYVGCMYQEFTQLQYNLGYRIRCSPALARQDAACRRCSSNYYLPGLPYII